MDYKKALLTRSYSSQPVGSQPVSSSTILTPTGYKTLEHYAYCNNMKEQIVDSDGHCILHAVSGALKSRSEDAMLHSLWKHIHINKEYYQAFSEKDTDLMREVRSWIENKDFGSDSVDLMVSALCNSENVTIQIYEESTNNGVVLNCNTPTLAPVTGRKCIQIAKRGLHYNFFETRPLTSVSMLYLKYNLRVIPKIMRQLKNISCREFILL